MATTVHSARAIGWLSLLALTACGPDRSANFPDVPTASDVSATDAPRVLPDGAPVCVPGTEQPCYDGPTGTQNVGACRAGTQNCVGSGEFGTWGACTGEITPQPDVCGDGIDHMCNGHPDADCGVDAPPDAATTDATDVIDAFDAVDIVDAPDVRSPVDVTIDVVPFDVGPPDGSTTIATGPVSDYDIAGDTRVFVAGMSGSTLVGQCFLSDGTARGPVFTITSDDIDSTDGPVQVNTARDAATTLVTWLSDATPGDYSSRTITSQLYDATCAPIGAPIVWPSGASGNYVFDAAIDAAGNFVLFWQSPTATTSYLSFYDATGTHLGTDLLVDPMKCTGNYGMHVALNATTGAGVVSCQGHEYAQIGYRRFDATHAWSDAAMLYLPETLSDHSSWYESHVLGMNDAGEFALEWEDYTAHAFQANFYAADGTFVRNVTVGADASMGYDAFRQRHQAAQIYGGTDFVFRDATSTVGFWRYSADGSTVDGCASSTLENDSLRIDGTLVPCMATSSTVVRDAVDLTAATSCP